MTSADDHIGTAGGGGHEDDQTGLRARISSQAEETLGRLADELLENPVINSALSSAFAAREKVAQAQQSAMGALNLPSASDIEKLERRLRSVSQRLEELEDGVERVAIRLDSLSEETRGPAARLEQQLERIELRIDRLSQELGALRVEAGRVSAEPPAIVPEG
jgi:TolA-binding protein